MSKKTPYLTKGSEFHCQSCKRLLVITNRDVFAGEVLKSDAVVAQNGTELVDGQLMICPNCHNFFSHEIMDKKNWAIK